MRQTRKQLLREIEHWRGISIINKLEIFELQRELINLKEAYFRAKNKVEL